MTFARITWHTFPAAVRAALRCAADGSRMHGGARQTLSQRLDSCQIAFFCCFFGFLANLPVVLLKKGH
jgi:hypothetical protein